MTDLKAGDEVRMCKHCGEPIKRCPIDPCVTSEGWRHTRFASAMPIGAHYCDGRSVNPLAEPVTAGGTPAPAEGGSP